MICPRSSFNLLSIVAALGALASAACEVRPATVVPTTDGGAEGDGISADPLKRYHGGALLLPSFKAQYAAFSPGLTHLALVQDNLGHPADLVLFDLQQATSKTLARDATSVEWLGEGRMLYQTRKLWPVSDSYMLVQYDVAAERATPLGEVCRHKVAPDHGSVVATRGACFNNPTLEHRQLAAGQQGTWQLIAKGVAWPARFSPDSRSVALLIGATTCAVNGAQLVIHDLASGKNVQVHATAQWPQFLSDGRLLFQDCVKDRQWVFSTQTGGSVELASKVVGLVPQDLYGLCKHYGEYQVSRDGKSPLGASSSTLYRIPTDGSGTVQLANDYYGGGWKYGLGSV